MTTDPIFILSAPRSGSTLLRVMLAGHPQLFSPPELHLLGFQAIQDRERGLGLCRSEACQKHGKCDQRHGLQRALMELQQIDAVGSRKLIDAMLERNEPIIGVYNLLFQLAAPRRLVDKTPTYAARHENLTRAEHLFPGAHYIYLYRHPYAVIESLLRNGFEPSLDKAESVWSVANGNALKFLETVSPARQTRIAYEQLVIEPERTMRFLCADLHIDFNAAVLNPYDGVRMTDGIRSGALPPDDANFRNHSIIDRNLAHAGSGLDLSQVVQDDTLRIAGALGYEIGVASAP